MNLSTYLDPFWFHFWSVLICFDIFNPILKSWFWSKDGIFLAKWDKCGVVVNLGWDIWDFWIRQGTDKFDFIAKWSGHFLRISHKLTKQKVWPLSWKKGWNWDGRGCQFLLRQKRSLWATYYIWRQSAKYHVGRPVSQKMGCY